MAHLTGTCPCIAIWVYIAWHATVINSHNGSPSCIPRMRDLKKREK